MGRKARDRRKPNLRRETFLGRRYKYVAGADEVGRGALAGPLTVAMVILQPPLDPFLASYLNDSKKLSPAMREKLFVFIKKNACSLAVSSVANTVIDKQKLTAATSLALHRCYKKMKEKPSCLLLDKGLSMPKAFTKAVPQYSLIKGDEKSAAIAAASIVAKVSRDRKMRTLHAKESGNEIYDFAQNKGYGVKKHLKALASAGPSRHHRQSYAPVKKFSASFSKPQASKETGT